MELLFFSPDSKNTQEKLRHMINGIILIKVQKILIPYNYQYTESTAHSLS